MAVVIEFLSKRKGRKAGSRFYGPAQVVLFTGVRIERLGDAPAESLNRRLPRRSNQATAEELE